MSEQQGSFDPVDCELERLFREWLGLPEYCSWCLEIPTSNIHLCDCWECGAPFGHCTHEDWYRGYDKRRLA